ncbi:cytochrome c [Aurantiacibacter rhizosphaerae]|uniref:Cytochrome c n=1 Tax=Aurantiacibacter rhizosphaerae TaxID=2691582 RepID=A0A844XH82_9SPHN|nr:cytochrome c [Aurantiacibacter rhizosphaerae]MWV29099.1 hypothetical protein [Aurantiacibacter rhizosphaerae]
MRWIPIAAIALAGCVAAPAIIPDTYYVREGMVHAINPPTEAIWNLQVEAMDDYGNFDPALMTQARWDALDAASAQLLSASQDMAAAGSYASHDPAGNLGDAPEGTDLAAIEARLKANPQSYNAFAVALANHAQQLSAAVDARDPEWITRMANDLQPVCKACHDVFWYPEEYR